MLMKRTTAWFIELGIPYWLFLANDAGPSLTMAVEERQHHNQNHLEVYPSSSSSYGSLLSGGEKGEYSAER